jgi:formylglycine-generating enzyme required for sulfatase activity
MARSDTITSRFYGNSNQLLGEYAWFCLNSKDPLRTNPVGLLLPNQFGFFDVLGNVHEWCTEKFNFIPNNGFHLWYENIEEGFEIRKGEGNPVLKGEGTDSLPNQLRCARNRVDRGAGNQHVTTGFRIARTLGQ